MVAESKNSRKYTKSAQPDPLRAHQPDDEVPGNSKPARKPRADSMRNRERLLDTARIVFAAGGPGASLEAVARGAGVGIGTLYRHFPTREALFQAVYEREVDELVMLADTLVAQDKPVAALRGWLHGLVRMVATKRGMLAALEPTLDNSQLLFSNCASRMLVAADVLLRSGVREGSLRGDVTADDMMRAVLGICYTKQDEHWQSSTIRLIDIFVDGLTISG